MKAKIRKIMTVVDETLTEQGQSISPPIRRAAAIAVIAMAKARLQPAVIATCSAENAAP